MQNHDRKMSPQPSSHWLLCCPPAICGAVQEEAGAQVDQPQAQAGRPSKPKAQGAAQMAQRAADAAGLSLGPIGLTIGSDLNTPSLDEEDSSSSGGSGSGGDNGSQPSTRPPSYASLTTDEWRALYEKDGAVDLWVQEEFNSGSRIVVS